MSQQTSSDQVNVSKDGKSSKKQRRRTILDDISIQVEKIATYTVKRGTNREIDYAIKALAIKERRLRESTITIRMTEEFDFEKIVSLIDSDWTTMEDELPNVYWQDKDNAYCQFKTAEHKNNFLDSVKAMGSCIAIKDLILPSKHGDGIHFVRRPVRIEFQNIRYNIKADKINGWLQLKKPIDSEISMVREGKSQGHMNKTRSIMFTCDANGFRYLFGHLDGTLPYVNLETNTRAILRMKVAIKPYQCNQCYAIGRHSCRGKVCSKCGEPGHTYSECTLPVGQCKNCGKIGHKARDIECPTYIYELIKEMRKADIPIEYFEDDDLRSEFIKTLAIK